MYLVRKLKSSCFDRGPWETGLPTGLLLNDNNFSRVTLNNVGRVSEKKLFISLVAMSFNFNWILSVGAQ